MSHLHTDNDGSKDNASRLESNSSFIHNFTNTNRASPIRKNLFTTDQEIFVDTYSPLILLNDTNPEPPLPSFYGGSRKEKERDDNAQGSSTQDIGASPKRLSRRQSLSPKKGSSPRKRRQTKVVIEGMDRRSSIAMSNMISDVLSVSNKDGKEPREGGSESASIMKAPIANDVDIFHHHEEPKKDLLVKENKVTKTLRKVLESAPFTIITILFTFFSLFSQDLSALAFYKGADFSFDVMSMIVLGWFGVEIMVAMFVKPGYAGTFFFYLDIISTVSILFDIDIFMDVMFSPGSVFQKVSKFLAVGIRAARVVRIVRLGALGKVYFKVMAHIQAKTKFLLNIVEQSGLAVLDLGLAATNKAAQLGLAAVDMGLAAGNKVKQVGMAAVDVGMAAGNKVRAVGLAAVDLGVAATNKVVQAGVAAKDAATGRKRRPRGKKGATQEEGDSAMIDLNANQSFSPTIGNTNLDNSVMAIKPSDKDLEIEEKKEDDTQGKDGKKGEKGNNRGKVRGSIEFLKKLRRKDALSFRFDMPEIPEPPEELKESRVAKRLSERTTKKVVLMILVTLFISPFFEADFFYDVKSSQTYQMHFIAMMIDDPKVPDHDEALLIQAFIDSHRDTAPKLISFHLDGDPSWDYMTPILNVGKIRDTELFTVRVRTQTKGEMVSVCTSKTTAELESLLSVGRTLFTCILICFGAIMVTKDARDLCLQPLERIIVKVNMIAKNPLWAKEQVIINDTRAGSANETVFVENAVIKIGGLLALGFGDAGSAIIAQNIARSGDINPMLPGKKKAAVYGFCDIRNFTDATEILQEEVMVFVNSIADVVHSLVDKFAGAANKNIGDAFLVVWKFPESAAIEMPDGQFDIVPSKITRNISDCALLAFLKVYARINREPNLLKYRENPGLNERLPNYRVKMGFGLHVGWAIEGAIGSDFKIDTSYLSPNVNMSSRLEAATKQYGVPLLFSGELYEMLSEPFQDISRLIDIVTVKGSIKPMELYTVDMDIEGISNAKDKTLVPKDERRRRQTAKKERISEMIVTGDISALLETDKELKYMLRNPDQEFDQDFSAGFEAYIEGDWATAKKKFDVCIAKRPEDGPTKNIMSVLDEYDHIAPEDWEGYHVLTEK